MTSTHQRFTWLWLGLTLAGLAGIALFNLLIDATGSYPAVHLKDLEPLRYLKHDRISKGELANRGDWEFIVLGSSRAKAGLPADHPVFQTNRACNLSLDAITVAELRAVFDFARRRNPVKQVLLCADYYMFCMAPEFILEFPQSRFNPAHDPLLLNSHLLLTSQALDNSFYLAKRHYRHYQPSVQNSLGFLDITLGAAESQRAVFDRTMRHLGPGYAQQPLSQENLKIFRGIVRTCREQSIRLEIALAPVHCLDLELLYAHGCWQDFEAWKLALTDILAEESSSTRLWDFTGYSGPPTEAVPPAGDGTTRMEYYLESSHFTPALGRIMLDTVYGTNQIPGFGSLLTPTTVRPHLARILEDRQNYAKRFPGEIAWVKQMVDDYTRKKAPPGGKKPAPGK